MATETFVDFTGLQYYDGKLKEKIAGEYATKSELPSNYQGATSSANGVAGLVPAAPSADKDKFLKGDGTWEQVSKEVGYSTAEPTSSSIASLDNESVIFYETQSMSSGAASPAPISITGNAATASSVGHSMSISVDGGAVEGASLYTFNGSAEKTVNIAGGTGISLTGVSGTVTINANPFRGATASVNGATGMVPASTVAEKDRFLRGDGTWAEVSLPDVYQGATISASGVAGLVPVASSAEKERFLKGDGTWAEVTTAKEVGYVSSEPTDQSVASMDAQAFVFYETENGTANSEQELNASITGTAAYASRLNHSLTIKINSGSTEGTNQYSFNGSSETALNFVSGFGAILSAEQGTVSVSVPAYQGATASANGVAGLVPPASSIQRNQYLKGDGTWGEVNVPGSYRGATAELEGTSGLVPAPAVVDRNKFLKGDGTWSELTLPAVYQGATPMESGIAGLVPSAAIADREKFLKGDGTWTAIQMPGVYVGANAYSSGTAGLVPSAESSEQDWFLCGNGAWTPLDLITNAEVDALFEE